MKRSRRTLVTWLLLPCLGACFATLPTPVPQSPQEREDLDVRGVVLAGRSDNGEGAGAEGDRIEFRDVQRVVWTDDAVSIVGAPTAGEDAGRMTERRFALSSLSALLVRQVDAGGTSALIGGVIVGGAALIALLVTGTSDNMIPMR